MGCGVWGVGEQGGFKEVFLSFITGGAPPVGLLLRKKGAGSRKPGIGNRE